MSSPISSALAKLDDCLQAVQVQVEYLRAGLDVDDNQLGYILADAYQSASDVRDLIRAERSDATWNGREALDNLIVELEIAAHEKVNEQRRAKLLDLADELEAGIVKHRSEARSTSLNHLRQDAIQQLRADASIAEQEKELPGPDAGEWMHWVCNLQEDRDADALQCLRNDFPALDQFAGEMEETYWLPGDRVRRAPVQTAPASPRRAPEAPSYSSPRPSSGAEYSRHPQNAGARPDAGNPAGNYATAVAHAYDRSANPAPVASEGRRSESSGGIALVAEPPQPKAATPVQEPVRMPAAPQQRTATRTTYPVADKPNPGNGATPISDSRTAVTAPLKPAASVVVTPVEKPKAQPQPQPAKPAEKKAKGSKQQQQQQRPQQQEQRQRPAAETAAAVAAAAEIARPKAAEPPRVVAEKEPRTKQAQALGDSEDASKWRTLLFTPQGLIGVAVLVCVVIGLSIWLMHRSPSAAAPAPAAATQGAIAPAQNAGTPVQSANASAPAAAPSNGAPANAKNSSDSQSKPQDQNSAAKPADTTQQKEPATNTAQVINLAPEAPKRATTAKGTETSSAEPPPMPGVVSGSTNGLGNIVGGMPVAVPKLAGQKLRVSSGVAQAQLVHQVTPQYPSEARQERVQGTVVLQAVIGKDGSVQKLNVISGPSQLTKSAMQAVKQWRYKPFSLNGESVEADTQINVNFKLGE